MKSIESKLKVVKTVGLLTVIFGGLSFYGFNCAPPSFEMADQASLSMSSDGSIVPVESVPVLDTKVSAPQKLLTSEQIYESMMNVTGQRATVTQAQLNEFNTRSGSFPEFADLEKVNSPMLVALTSFSGEVCNGLVAREQAAQAAQRKYFQNVNFGGAISTVSNDIYQGAITNLAQSIWGRAPSSEEITIFTQFKADYVAAIAANQVNNAAQTRGLMLSTCTAMLSTFDLYTY